MTCLPQASGSAKAADVDQLLQDSYLLVVELQQGAPLQEVAQLHDRCVAQIENVRARLEAAGMSQANINHISHAHCALLDETILGRAKDHAHATWASEPLQAKFFSHHQAGESFYEQLRELMRQPSPDLQTLTVYQRVLMLGFRGRYHDVDAPERQQLLMTLNEQVSPMRVSRGITTQTAPDARLRFGLHSMLAQGIGASLLLVAVWLGLDWYLTGVVTTLLTSSV